MPEKKGEKSLKEARMPPLPFANKIKKPETADKGNLTVDQMLKEIEEMNKRHDQISLQVDEILQRTGWNPKYLETYLSNPNNFSPQEWESLNKQRKELFGSIGLSFNIEEKGKKSETASEASAGKERRKKLGARRNWLPMR